MDRDALWAEIEKFISAHNTCALATCCHNFVRCSPIEYSYKNEKFWILSEGVLKFRALEHNKNVCLAIYDDYTGFAQLYGMQITATAEIVEPWTGEYMDLLAFKKVLSENLKRLPTTLSLIKVTPSCIDFLCLEFKKRCFDPQQHLRLSNKGTEIVIFQAQKALAKYLNRLDARF